VRLRGLFTGDLLWVELDSYVRHLPMESLTRTAQRDALTDDQLADLASSSEDPKHGAWSKSDYLLAEVIDKLSHLVYIQTAKSVKDPKSIPLPEPRRRPGVSGKRAPRVDPKAVAYLTLIREKNRREAG
jgi:hypothetical protein